MRERESLVGVFDGTPPNESINPNADRLGHSKMFNFIIWCTPTAGVQCFVVLYAIKKYKYGVRFERPSDRAKSLSRRDWNTANSEVLVFL